MSPSPTAPDRAAILWLRRSLLAILILGLVGVLAELLLLGHFEDPWQYAPLVLIGLALASIVWQVRGGGVASLRLMQATMILFVVAGAAGVVLHYRGSLEFQLEMDATQHGWALFKKIIQAKAPPALAPGAMTQLGLLGLAYAFRHPDLGPASGSSPPSTTGV